MGLEVIYQQPGIVLALLFVTYPFVIRSVQPVLLEVDRGEEEAAATLGAGPWTIFRRVTFPTLFPSILTGTALAFSRALGEFGSVVMVAGNRPLETKTGPMYVFGEIESGNRHGAMVVSAVLLASSLGILIVLNLIQRRAGGRSWRMIAAALKSRAGARLGSWSGSVVAWFALLILVPTLALARKALEGGFRPFWECLDVADARRSFGLTIGITAAGDGGQHAVRPGLRDGPGPPAVLGPGAGRWPGRPAVRGLADHRGPDAGDRLRAERLARVGTWRPGASGWSTRGRGWSWRPCS